MINEREALRRLHLEAKHLRYDNHETDFIKGTVNGLMLAIHEINKLTKETKEYRLERLGQPAKWPAQRYYRTLRHVYHRLQVGGRKEVMTILQKALDRHETNNSI